MTQEVGGRRFGSIHGPVCDFCIGPDPNWVYTTEKFWIPPSGPHPPYFDDGEWGACDTCKADIEAERWHHIAARLYENMKKEMGPNERIDNASREWHDRLVAAFIEHRNGEPRWEPD